MISPFRAFELIVYAILNLLPYILIALYSVKDQLRWSKPIIICSLLFLCSMECVRIILVSGNYYSAAILSPLNLLIQSLFYVYVSNQAIGRSAFVLLSLSNIASSIGSLAKYLEGFLFPLLAVEKYRWSFSLCVFVLEIFFLIPIFYYVKYIYTPITKDNQTTRMNRFLWVIPAIFYIIWYCYIFMNQTPTQELLLSSSSTVVQLAIMAGALLSYHTIISLVKEHSINNSLLQTNNAQHLQLAHYGSIQEKIDEAARTRHDLRHHMHLLYYFAEEGDVQSIKEYIESYKEHYIDKSVISFCENHTANIILHHFHERARISGISFSAKAHLPHNLPFAKEELTVLFANLLENAIDASREESDASIIVHTKFEKGFLFLHVSNTSTKEPNIAEDGHLISTKSNPHMHGFGLNSVNHIVKKHKGLMDVSHENGIFSCCVQIPLESC